MAADTNPRMLMRLMLAPHAAPATAHAFRTPTPADAEAFAVLMFEAYAGTVDDEGGTLEQAREEVRKTFANEYGRYDASCSRVLERSGVLANATIITSYREHPLIAFSLTSPAFQRQGLARAGMQQAIAALAASGATQVQLIVTKANTPAVRLYESLGFIAEG